LDNLQPTASGDRSEPLVQRGSRLPATDVPEAVESSGAMAGPARGSDPEEGASGVELPPAASNHSTIEPVDLPTSRRLAVPAGQSVEDTTRPETGVSEDRPGIGLDEYVGQRGLGELLRRWEDVQAAGTATTFPGAKPVPVHRAGAIRSSAGRPRAGRPDAHEPGADSPGADGAGKGPEISGSGRVRHDWPAALAPADPLGGHDDLEDAVEEALEALVLREAERHGLDAGAP
jgi:hypothetical protein